MTSGIYRFVLRDTPANDVTPKLLGAPRADKRDAIEERFERERAFHELVVVVQALSVDVRRIIPAISIRVVPLGRCTGAKLICEMYSGSYSIHNAAMFSALEMRNIPFMRERVGSMIAHILNTIAKQIEYSVVG